MWNMKSRPAGGSRAPRAAQRAACGEATTAAACLGAVLLMSTFRLTGAAELALQCAWLLGLLCAEVPRAASLGMNLEQVASASRCSGMHVRRC